MYRYFQKTWPGKLRLLLFRLLHKSRGYGSAGRPGAEYAI